MPLKFTPEELAAFREEYARGSTDAQFTIFISECERRSLIPGQHIIFQLRGSKEWDAELKVEKFVKKMVKITAIDALRLISQRTGEYEGQGEGEFYYLDDNNQPTVVSKIPLPHPTLANTPREPWAAAIPIYRKGFREPVRVVARFDAYAVMRKGKDGWCLSDVWSRRGPEMLLKCSEAAARRAAFPEELSGLYISEEFEKEQATEHEPVAAQPVASAPQAPVVPEVNHAPAVATDTPRPNEKLPPEAKKLVEGLPAEVVQEKPVFTQSEPPEKAAPKSRKKADKPETTVEVGGNPPADGFKATDEDLPPELFEPDIQGKSPENGQIAVQAPQLDGKAIAEKVRGYYSLADRADLQAYILKKTGKAKSSEITPEQWGEVFAALDEKVGDKQAFSKFVKDGGF